MNRIRAVLTVFALALIPHAWADNADIVRAAQSQVGVTTRYDGSYRALNIDHRRVSNLMTYFGRQGYTRAPSRDAAAYLPGDIVAWDLGRGLLHIGVISDLRTVEGTPLVVHNIGAGAREEDILFRYTVIGHYRLPASIPTTILTPPGP